MDTIEKIEKDFNREPLYKDYYKELQTRILIQIAYQLRVIAGKGAG